QGDAAEQRGGTRNRVDRQGLQGPRAGIWRRDERRPVGLGVGDVAERAGERSVQTGNKLRSRLDRLSAVSQWSGDDPRISGLRQGRRAERLEFELGRAPEFPTLGKPLRLLRVPPTLAEPGQFLRGGRERLAV